MVYLSGKRLTEKLHSLIEKNFDSLSSYHQLHFAVRMYRISGRKQDARKTARVLASLQPEIQKDLAYLDNRSYQNQRGLTLAKALFTTNSPRNRQKNMFYRKNPSFRFFLNVIYEVNLLYDFNLLSAFQLTQLKSWYLRGVGGRWITDKKLWLVDPSRAINTIYFLANLGIADLRPQLRSLIVKYYTLIAQPNSCQHLSYYYILTHLIINESGFYQHHPVGEMVHWVYTRLLPLIPKIIASRNLDLIAETGLALKLLKPVPKNEIIRLSAVVKEKWNQNLADLPVDISSCEHRLAMAIMLLSIWDKLFPGPDLSKFDKF